MNRSAKLSWIAAFCAVPLLLPACERARERAREVAPQKSWFTCQVPPGRKDEAFGTALRTAMVQMDEAMNVVPSGDPDRDFAAMMVPHHQGAVDMALVELRFGHDERLRRLAAGIIVEQRSEITLLQQILRETKPALSQTAATSQTSETTATSQTVLVGDKGARK